MKILFFILCLCALGFPLQVSARAPHIVLNFAQMNELPWGSDETTWEKNVKPQVVKEIQEMRTTLGEHTTEGAPILAWSTLMEYMNFPMDTPSSESVYVVKLRRILELAEELNFPVFIPLNGFQWWDELPELYNYWDPDGTHTDPNFFSRQDNPQDFKKRFIAGFDPNNIYNVEWQNSTTPMQLNYRNWGGGGFRLAPPPNLMKHTKSTRTYRSVQTQRLKAIVQEIASVYERWKKEGKESLLVGISIGTEISLNASVFPRDEFAPYGNRAILDLLESNSWRVSSASGSDTLCNTLSVTCSKQTARIEVIRRYLEDNARLAQITGIPKEKIYTHVLGENDSSDPHYGPYADAAFNLYSLPGSSFYGHAQDPLSSSQWTSMLEKFGNPTWGALEYSAGDSESSWTDGLTATFFNTRTPANLLVIYNWDDHIRKTAVQSIRSVLKTQIKPTDTCTVNPAQLHTPQYAKDPEILSWKTEKGEHNVVYIQTGTVARFPTEQSPVYEGIDTQIETKNLPFGTYVWFVETQGCNKKVFSEPRIFTKSYPETTSTIPRWVENILSVEDTYGTMFDTVLPFR